MEARIPSSTHFAKLMGRIAERRRDNILRTLPPTAQISIMFDSWTRPNRQNSVLGVICFFLDDNWKRQQVLLGFADCSTKADALGTSELLYKILDGHHLAHRFSTMTTDNGAHFSLQYLEEQIQRNHQLYNPPLKLTRIRCTAHIWNLVASEIYDTNKVLTASQGMDDIEDEDDNQLDDHLQYDDTMDQLDIEFNEFKADTHGSTILKVLLFLY